MLIILTLVVSWLAVTSTIPLVKRWNAERAERPLRAQRVLEEARDTLEDARIGELLNILRSCERAELDVNCLYVSFTTRDAYVNYLMRHRRVMTRKKTAKGEDGCLINNTCIVVPRGGIADDVTITALV